MRPPLVLVAHGTSSRAGMSTVEHLVAEVRAGRPGVPVELCYVDVARPRLSDLLGSMTGPVVVVPLLLSTGFHVRRDIPTAVAACPGARVVVAPPLGPDPALAVALADRLREAGHVRGPVVLAAAGSRDPAAAGQVDRMARMLGSYVGESVHPGYAHVSAPGGEDVCSVIRRLDPRPAVATYLIADGYFARRIAAAGALTSAPIGAHPALVRLVLRRYDSAVMVRS
jgi:sirohydrochlorin ferrochelatase